MTPNNCVAINNTTTMDNVILNFCINAHSNVIIVGLIFAGFFINGVFGVTDEMSISVMEGDSVTLHSSTTEIQKADLITWTFGSDRTRIAQINRSNNKVSLYDDALDGRFRDRLTLDDQTGSLTITNTSSEHTGLYEQQTFGGDEASPKRFSVTVFTPLPIPLIIRNCSSSSSSSSCSVLCSVVNVSHVTLSWLKGHSLLSSISVSDLSISLSLPLEVEDQEKNTYSCVLNNPITHRTTHLDISTHCHTCEGPDWSVVYIPVCALLLAFMFFLCGIYCHRKWRRTKPKDKDRPDGEELACLKEGVVIEKDEIKFVSATVGESVTLQTDLKNIQENELIRWKFAFSNKHNQGEFVVIAKWDQTNNEEYVYNEERFRDRLTLDHNTGSLTIANIKPKHYGHYKLHISSEEHSITKTLIIVAHVSRKRQGTIERRQTCP